MRSCIIRRADAAYIELYNTSTNYAFDLSNGAWTEWGWFPAGTILTNDNTWWWPKPKRLWRGFWRVPVAGYFAGNWIPKARRSPRETGPHPVAGRGVNQVRYENSMPWPRWRWIWTFPAIDRRPQDNTRSAIGRTARLAGIGSVPPQIGGARLYVYLDTAGDVILTTCRWWPERAESGSNLVQDGDSNRAERTWMMATNYTNSTISTAVSHSGNASAPGWQRSW